MRICSKMRHWLRGRRNRRKCLLLTGFFLLATLIACYLSRNTKTPIYVVEEHHEALLYWFHAVEQGYIPSANITLIHIDGHSDLSMPEFFPGMRAFQQPMNEELDIIGYVQRNDAFIQAGVILGFISRVIWIWPSWDKTLKENKDPYEISAIHVGWYEPSDSLVQSKHDVDSKPTQPMSFCKCEGPAGEVISDSPKEFLCSRANYSAVDEKDQEREIPWSECRIVKSIVLEMVNDKAAVEMFKSSEEEDWVKGIGSHVVWDIDEDFFGCENPSKTLVSGKGALAWSIVMKINEKLQDLICVRHLGHEDIGHKMLIGLIKIIQEKCRNRDSCGMSLDELFKETNKIMIRTFRTNPSVFCGRNDAQIRNIYHSLVIILSKLSSASLDKLIETGFCLNRTPKSAFDMEPLSLRVCHGLNEPNSNLVYLYTPTHYALLQHLATFDRLVQVLPKPQTITLCRSVRDGYTPRALAGEIEGGILEALWRWVGSVEVNYDDDLLGSERGWAHRNT